MSHLVGALGKLVQLKRIADEGHIQPSGSLDLGEAKTLRMYCNFSEKLAMLAPFG